MRPALAIDDALATQCLMPLFNMAPIDATARHDDHIFLIQAGIVVLFTRIVGWINSLAVGVELAVVVVLGVALVVAVVVTGHGSTHNLVSQGVATGRTDYFALGGGLMAALIMGLKTLIGFEAAANMAEEVKNPLRDVPRGDRRTGGNRRLRRCRNHAPAVRSRAGTALTARDCHRVLRSRGRRKGRDLPDDLRDVTSQPLSRPPSLQVR